MSVTESNVNQCTANTSFRGCPRLYSTLLPITLPVSDTQTLHGQSQALHDASSETNEKITFVNTPGTP
jgi:hypothetical protein